jgi:hypothetical protein
VEWYFGANNEHNDLTTEDWRTRERLWELTQYALDFFNSYLPYWEMEPLPLLVNSSNAYCLGKAGEVYALYLPGPGNYTIDLKSIEGTFEVKWYDPINGGSLQEGTVLSVEGDGVRSFGQPVNGQDGDRVVLIRKLE